jgi:putative ubiquitin-RnfH superfamily antitoxin RatB of RatAB toxin-antitoxin module
MSNTIAIEVAYALPDKQRIIKLDVPEGTTVMQAVIMSQMDSIFEDLTLSEDLKLGVWGKPVTADRALVAGERVEIYRPLLVDPKEVRRARAARAKAARSESELQDASVASSADGA